MLQERRASPSELAGELGTPLGRVSYHVRVLAQLKLIRLVKKTPRRGAIEHHYEAAAPAQISTELWATVPTITKQAIVGAALGEIGRAVEASASAGGFDRGDVHLSRSRLVLDERGWVELAAELARTLEKAERIQRQSERRLKSSDHQGEMNAALVVMLFEDVPKAAASASDGGPCGHDRSPSERRARG